MNLTTFEAPAREQLSLVIVGHVDHGKSTLVGRMLADTGSIDPGRLARVKAICERQGKRFEYAFLLDALEAEQAQGITIDAARCFFHGEQRDYILIDAPGHIEFLKNMISGAARAEAAILLIDAEEGVQENSRRHGYLLSLLGIRQVVVAVNKMDRIGYDQAVFDRVEREYRDFLGQISVTPAAFIPVSALEGGNVVTRSAPMPWYQGPTILQAMERFEKEAEPADQPLRFPVQDVYKFNRAGDARRIIAGRITSGTLRTGDEVVFLPSGKKTRIKTIEAFNADALPGTAQAGQSVGVTMTEQIYASRGDVMCHPDRPLQVSNRLRVNLVWLGRAALRAGQVYKLKLGTFSGLCEVERFIEVIDASALRDSGHEDRVERHEVAEVVLRLRDPIACDLSHEFADTGRFVLVDGYDMAGGGIIREVLSAGEKKGPVRWTSEVGSIDRRLRETRQGHRAVVVALHEDLEGTAESLAAAIEESLWTAGRHVFRLRFEAVDVIQPRPGELNLRTACFGRVAALANAGQVVLATIPFAASVTQQDVLRLPGLESVPCAQVRFRGDRDDALDWVLDPAHGERELHEEVRRRLDPLLALGS
ncbi:MAG: 50S ribosome-binding GTPase [Myxococcales bacterium]|nr:50S ribosome-binding GTPase [Myxococcales bacterium]MCB9548813.1 50S ribosome-binding GTPase [Myxococcales bacterium]